MEAPDSNRAGEEVTGRWRSAGSPARIGWVAAILSLVVGAFLGGVLAGFSWLMVCCPTPQVYIDCFACVGETIDEDAEPSPEVREAREEYAESRAYFNPDDRMFGEVAVAGALAGGVLGLGETWVRRRRGIWRLLWVVAFPACVLVARQVAVTSSSWQLPDDLLGPDGARWYEMETSVMTGSLVGSLALVGLLLTWIWRRRGWLGPAESLVVSS